MDSPLLIIFVGIFIGLVKGGVTGPIGGALVLPLLSQTMSVQQAAGITLLLMLTGDVFAMYFYWRQWDAKIVRLVLPAALVGIVLGVWMLVNLPESVLRPVLGILTLVTIAYKFMTDTIKSMAYEHRSWHGLVAGFVAGATSAMANIGGPPMSAYLLLRKLQPVTFVGTMTLFFAIVNLVKLPFFFRESIIDVQMLLNIAWVLPLIPLGVWLGRRAIGWINRLWFERAIMVLVLFASLLLIFNNPG